MRGLGLGSGKLSSAQSNVTKNVPDPPGDYTMSIATVDGAGVPTNSVLASTTIPESAAPGGSINVPITGTFAQPAAVTAGTTYALVISRPAAGANGLRLQGRTSGCPGSMFRSTSQTNPYTDNGADLVFNAFVDGSPPLVSLTKRPKKKTGSDRAKFKFAADEPGVSYLCSLDKAKFKTCSSPRKYKNLDEGGHSFRLKATDPVGNEATTRFKWTVPSRIASRGRACG